jgi:indolepyruvate decarboxylase
VSTASVAEYLLDRLADIGVRHLFGVPGDFTLRFLDYVEAHPAIEWVGCANELGAGYAADGYARLAGFGALCTTFGVGELSAIGAVAGSYAEHVPVVHVVGAPTRAVQRAGRATHHTLGDGDFGHFVRMNAEVTVAQAVLTAENAVDEIDRVLAVAQERRRPVYVMLPADVVDAPVARRGGSPRAARDLDRVVLDRFRESVARRVAQAADVAVLADILVQRLGAEAELHRLLDEGVPHATLLWGRRVVDEQAPAYLGSYLGAGSDHDVRAAIEDADLVVVAGVQFTDLTSGFFSQHIAAERSIEIGGDASRVGTEEFAPLPMAAALNAVADAVAREGGRFARERSTSPVTTTPVPADAEAAVRDRDDSPLDQERLWSGVSTFLRAGDVVIADQGTAFYGMADHRLPSEVTFIGQPLWAAIGYTLPALVGAALAAPGRRPILLIGDGAAQVTIAELGTLLRRRIPAIVLVIDNGGYTIERVIHGPDAVYNDIAQWDWVALAAALGGDAAGAGGVRATTAEELVAALAHARNRDALTLIQAVVPAADVPPVLRALADEAAQANRSTP